ncbi:aspartyl protease family protein [Maricaulis sp.]|uniref:retropepsin-like aspartic protease n=1 Tax=Maricaulis sp. TaxID=1486257 RepID=UPI0026148DBB|nr:aspartyl protease family protein [Maricaulis sp.]
MIRLMVSLSALLVPAISAPGLPQDRELPELLNAPIEVERPQPVASTALETRFGKLFLNATVNGETHEFIFDTGSPTMLSRSIAERLGLTTIGHNTGLDANGNSVTMAFALVDELAVGGAVFHDVPVLVFDFTELSLGGCIIDGGILGSEILAGSAWLIDTENETLSFAANADALGSGEAVVDAGLSDFGYPHAPIIAYQVGDVTDRALFDTGSAEAVSLFRTLIQDASVRDAIAADSMVTGRGSEGESAGGYGEITDLARFTLEAFSIDGQSVAPLRANTRGAPPTLVGAGMLDTYRVRLDYPQGRFVLERRDEALPDEAESGYSVAFVDGQARVVQIFSGSPAAEAGLQLGDQVIAIDGRRLDVTPASPMCETALWLLNGFDAARGGVFEIQRGDTRMTVSVPPAGQ